MLKNTGKFAGKTILITGASRGIGKEIGLKLAKDGANIVIAAKTAKQHSKLEGTIFTAADEMIAAGGKALPCIVDVRDEKSVDDCIKMTVSEFGGIDILINNASAINLSNTMDIDMKKYDLMHNINSRGTFLMTKKCLPHMKSRENPHVLMLSPPLNMNSKWFDNHCAYSMAKYGMSMQVLGHSQLFKQFNIGVNALWPRTVIWTAAMNILPDIKNLSEKVARKPIIVADAAYAILSCDSKKCTGNFFIDEEVLKSEGIKDFDIYAFDPKSELMNDYFLEFKDNENVSTTSSTKTDNVKIPGELGNIVEKFIAKVNSDDIKSIKAVYQFIVKLKTGNPQEFYFDLKETGKFCLGKTDNANTTLEIKEADLISILTGKRGAAAALAMGKLKIKGDMASAMKLEKLFKKVNSK